MADDNDLSGLDERLGLDQRPTTLMGSITASITDAVRAEADKNTEVLGQLLARVGRLDRHLSSLAAIVDGTGQEGVVLARLDELADRLARLEAAVAEPAPSAEIANVADGLTELRRALASARRAIDDGLHDLRAALPPPVDLGCLQARLDEIASRPMPEQVNLDSVHTKLDEIASRPVPEPVDLEPVHTKLDEIASRPMPEPVDLEPVHARLDELASRPGPERVDLDPVHAKLDELASRPVAGPVDLSGVHTRLDEIASRPVAEPVDLEPVHTKLDEIASRPMPEPVDLSGVHTRLDEIASRPVAEPVDLSGVQARLDEIASRPMPEPVDLDSVHAKLDELASRPAPDPVDFSGVHTRLDALASRPVDLEPVHTKLDELAGRAMPEPVDIKGVEAAVAKLDADLDAVRLLVAQASRAPDVARLLSDVTLLRQEVSATQDRLQGVDRTLIAFRADVSGTTDAQSMFRVSEAVAATATAIARLERRVGVGLDELRDLIERGAHAAAPPPAQPAPAPRALPAAPGETRERVAGQFSDRLSRIREAAAGVSDAVRAERARRRQL
ncbi:MAG: hypothetical protein JWO37_3596 [Acidimicrobiales bacterium]|jgi:hypothetical protein|nr:hypothetical protein [Acidimicrobiales bacterium]